MVSRGEQKTCAAERGQRQHRPVVGAANEHPHAVWDDHATKPTRPLTATTVPATRAPATSRTSRVRCTVRQRLLSAELRLTDWPGKAASKTRRTMHGSAAFLSPRIVDEAELRSLDPNLLTLFDVNTPEDMARAQRIAYGDVS
jgi:hypothetical protein